MPVVGRRNHHSIDIIPLDNVTKIVVSCAIHIAIFFIDHIAGYVFVISINIANSKGLCICIGKKVRKINRSTVTTHTDKAYCNPFTRRDSPCLTQR